MTASTATEVCPDCDQADGIRWVGNTPPGQSEAWDGTAGQAILVARQRGWPVLTADPGRLHRIAPDLDLDLL
jgi:hypothetical protein